MAININKIKNKLNELQNIGGTRTTKVWKPTIGKHRVRILPFAEKNDGMPFIELWWYYNILPYGLFALYKFGKDDPIREFQQALYEEGSEKSRELANRLWPKCTTYAPVIFRGEEENGPVWLSLNAFNAEKLYKKFADDFYLDITDAKNGHDIEVTVSQTAGRKYKNIELEVRPEKTELTSNPEVVKALVESIPNLISEVYADRLKSYEELKDIFENWMESKDSKQPDDSVGSEHLKSSESTTVSNKIEKSDKTDAPSENTTTSMIDSAFDKFLNKNDDIPF